MFGIGFSELLILAIIALLVFGPKKLPEIGSAVGKGMKEFKDALNAPVAPIANETISPSETVVQKAETK